MNLKQIETDIGDIKRHIETINGEQGQSRDRLTCIETNQRWIMWLAGYAATVVTALLIKTLVG